MHHSVVAAIIAIVVAIATGGLLAQHELLPRSRAAAPGVPSALLEAASERQVAALRDGVTSAEYADAAEAYVGCVEAAIAGVTVIREPVVGGRSQFDFRYDPALFGRGQRIVDSCFQHHLAAVDYVFAQATKPDDAYLQSARDALATCLRLHGVSVPPSPSRADLELVIQAVLDGTIAIAAALECSLEVSERFQLPRFFG